MKKIALIVAAAMIFVVIAGCSSTAPQQDSEQQSAQPSQAPSGSEPASESEPADEPQATPPQEESNDLLYSFEFEDVNGKVHKLSDYKGKWLIIESGSLTCPMYVKNVRPFDKLKGKYPDIEWLVIYVREAHPGEKSRQAQTMEEKIGYAKRNREE